MTISIRELEVFFKARPDNLRKVGFLAEREHRLFFEYHPDWLAEGLELSPFVLPLQPGLFEHKDRKFGPIFGLFDDSLPDGWGLLLMDRYFRALGLEPASVSPLDRLAFFGQSSMGALVYHPPADREKEDGEPFDLYELAVAARDILTGKTDKVLPGLLRAGGSPGGARPKVLVGYNPATDEMISGEDDLPSDFEHWLIKFHAREDEVEAGKIEYTYSLMARTAGVKMIETKLFNTGEQCFFGVKRFDRQPGNRRRHVHTLANLIHADFRVPCCDYNDVFKATSMLTRDQKQVVRAFRLMVFNVLAGNRDDHAKNFAFILDDKTGQWALSPGYDLTFSSGPGGEHTTSITGKGKNIIKQDFLLLAERYNIAAPQATAIIDEVSAAVGRFPEFAEAAGVSKRNADEVNTKLVGYSAAIILR